MTDAAVFRLATITELPAIVQMLADDELGRTREQASLPLPTSYETSFAAIDSDPNHELWLAEVDGVAAGVLQLTFIPNLSYRGSWRALIEGVRVTASHRSRGLGRGLITHAIEQAKARGCRLVQLTSDRRRPDAIRFYESLGFQATHVGLKLHLP